MIIKCNSKIIEIIFALFVLANNCYTVYLMIYNKDCTRYYLYDVAILSIVCNMITFALVSIFIIRDIENHYYSMLFAFFTILSGVASGLLLTIFINYNVINGPHCSHTFFYIVIINCLSSIIPVVLFILYLIGLVMCYIPYDVIRRQCMKTNTERYVQTDPETIGLMDNESGKTFVFPPNEIYEFDAVEI